MLCVYVFFCLLCCVFFFFNLERPLLRDGIFVRSQVKQEERRTTHENLHCTLIQFSEHHGRVQLSSRLATALKTMLRVVNDMKDSVICI